MSKARLVINAVTVEKRPVSEVTKVYGAPVPGSTRCWPATRPRARRVPGNRAGRRANTMDARPTRRRASSQHTPPALPVRAVRGKPSGYTNRASGLDPVRYASVDPATHRPVALQGDTHRDREETPR
jgi:hypothetical protein